MSNHARLREITAKTCLEHKPTIGFSTLGIGTATGSITKEQHRAVDVETNRAFALGCADSKQVSTFVFLSSVAADPTADENGSGTAGGSRYLRVKGESEEAVKGSGIPTVRIFQPAMIAGSVNTPCIFEWMEPCCWLLCLWCCLPLRYHGIKIADLGMAMALAGLASEPKGNSYFEYPEMMELLKVGE